MHGSGIATVVQVYNNACEYIAYIINYNFLFFQDNYNNPIANIRNKFCISNSYIAKL